MKFFRNLTLALVASLALSLGVLRTDIAVAQITNPNYSGPCGKPQTFTAYGLIMGNGTSNCTAIAPGASGYVLTSNGPSAAPTYQAAGGGSGTVTSVSVVSANGLAGTVATATTTPAITLSTSITGVLKGNGTAISAAVSGTDYAPASSGSSILYGNGSGGFSPVTVGSGLSFSGGTLTATAGGSGTVGAGTTGQIAYYPANGTTVQGESQVTVAQGGTGAATLTQHGVVIGNGTSAVNVTAAGTAGQCLTSNGASADPTYQTCGTGALNQNLNQFNNATQSIATTATALTNSTYAVVASGVYSFDVYLYNNGGTTQSISFNFGNSTATMTLFQCSGESFAGGTSASFLTSGALATNLTWAPATQAMNVHCVFTVNAAGNFSMQGTASTSAQNILASRYTLMRMQ